LIVSPPALPTCTNNILRSGDDDDGGDDDDDDDVDIVEVVGGKCTT
jgi:hypothetical protein